METYSEIVKTLLPEFPFAAWQIAQVEAFVRRLLRNASVTEEQLLLETRKYCQLRMKDPDYWGLLQRVYFGAWREEDRKRMVVQAIAPVLFEQIETARTKQRGTTIEHDGLNRAMRRAMQRKRK
jgi:hypothetical protein